MLNISSIITINEPSDLPKILTRRGTNCILAADMPADHTDKSHLIIVGNFLNCPWKSKFNQEKNIWIMWSENTLL